MNPEQLLNQVEQAMSVPPTSISGKWLLTIISGKIVLVNAEFTPHPIIIFATITDEQLACGLTQKEWNQLKTKLTNYFSQKGLS